MVYICYFHNSFNKEFLYKFSIITISKFYKYTLVMEFLKLYIISQLFFLLFQFYRPMKLESYQYCELLFGSLFIFLFFGIIQSFITFNMDVINNASLIACFYSIWYYLTKKISNLINSDKNDVIQF